MSTGNWVGFFSTHTRKPPKEFFFHPFKVRAFRLANYSAVFFFRLKGRRDYLQKHFTSLFVLEWQSGRDSRCSEEERWRNCHNKLPAFLQMIVWCDSRKFPLMLMLMLGSFILSLESVFFLFLSLVVVKWTGSDSMLKASADVTKTCSEHVIMSSIHATDKKKILPSGVVCSHNWETPSFFTCQQQREFFCIQLVSFK